MLRNATPADLPDLVALRCAAYGGTQAAAAGWLQNIAGLGNLLLLTRQTDQGEMLVSMLAAVPVECGMRRGIWFSGMATVPQARGQGVAKRLLDTCLRAYAAKGLDFAVAAPENSRAAQGFAALGFQNAFALRCVQKPIEQNLWAQAEFDNMTVHRLLEVRRHYQPSSITLPETAMTEMVAQLYSRGMTLVANRRGYGLYYTKGDALQFIELQADNDHSADLLLQAARQKTGAVRAQILLAENQAVYLGAGKRCNYGMIRYLQQPFPVSGTYFRVLV